MVKHKICNNVESLDELRRSKYVQSRIGTVLQDTKKYLDKGINVLFVGTPCQVDGLLSYLGKRILIYIQLILYVMVYLHRWHGKNIWNLGAKVQMLK